MCRLLCVKSKKDFDIPTHLEKFAHTARYSKEYQGHGWGCAFLKDGKWENYRSIKPIWENGFKQFSTTKLLLAHARSAFRNKDITVENNMPFFYGRNAFIFNGELHGVRINEAGRTGAEKLFKFIKRFDNVNMGEALEKAIEQLSKRTKYIKAANIIISDGKNIYWASTFNEDFDYFTMHYKIENSLQIIASEPYAGDNTWEKITQGSKGVL